MCRTAAPQRGSAFVKVDRDSEREVSRQEGAAFAKSKGCLFVETSAKANTAVTQVSIRMHCSARATADKAHNPHKAANIAWGAAQGSLLQPCWPMCRLSRKQRLCVQAFEELVRQIMDTPELLASGNADSPHGSSKVDVSQQRAGSKPAACAC